MMELEAIKALLSRTVAYHPDLARLLNSVNAAVMLSQGMFWQRIAESRGEKEFSVTMEEWELYTGLSPEKQASARKILIGSEVWSEAKRGVPARIFYLIKVEKLITLLTEFLARSGSGFPGTLFWEKPARKNPKLGSGFPGNIPIKSLIEENKEREGARDFSVSRLPLSEAAAQTVQKFVDNNFGGQPEQIKKTERAKGLLQAAFEENPETLRYYRENLRLRFDDNRFFLELANFANFYQENTVFLNDPLAVSFLQKKLTAWLSRANDSPNGKATTERPTDVSEYRDAYED